MASKIKSTSRAKRVAGKKEKKISPSKDDRKKVYAFKYSSSLTGKLYESVTIAGQPAFLTYDDNKKEMKVVPEIEEATRIIKPVPSEGYPYEAYSFSNYREVKRYVEIATQETVDSLYVAALKEFQNFNEQEGHKLWFLAAVAVWSYFQDKFATTPYINLVGDNGSGKSALGATFGAIGYRPLNLTDPSPANYTRVLGTLESGQCTIIADEAESIDRSPDLMNILKTGYDIRGRVSKINLNTYTPEYFFTYCLKLIIAEKSPDQWKAKGVMDRTFQIHCYRGLPKHDIKEALNPAGNKRRQRLLHRLVHLRKLLLIYRLMHFDDYVLDLDVGVQGRDKELVKPLLQLFCGSMALDEVKDALQQLLDEKNSRKQYTLESVLVDVIINLIAEDGTELYVSAIWNRIIQQIPGTHDDKRPHEFQTVEYGTLYNNNVTKLLADKFGATRKRRSDGIVLRFDKDKLERFARAYRADGAECRTIEIKIIEDEDEKQWDKVEGSEGDEGSNEADDQSAEEPDNNELVPCAFCEHAFSNEEEAIGHMVAVHPTMGG
jgi:hypothetical protein